MNEKTVWLLTVGEYGDYTVLGVFFGTEVEALIKSQRLTFERSARHLQFASDMIKVSIEKAEVLS